MSNALEIYREWEDTGSRTRVHVMQIDRGDNSAANRLTLTDKPYYDKGVSGSKYHDTYPAPVQAIISDIVTDESLDGTRFDDIILANGDGRFDNLLTEAEIVGHDFTMLRGDQDWSLMETAYPYKFIPIFRGRIEQVVIGRDTVRLVILPVKYKLENVLATQDSPVGLGKCRNVPAVLVDSATDRYRFNSVETLEPGYNFVDDLNLYFFVRDKGVELQGPDASSPDFTTVLEGGVFKGLIELTGGPPIGQLTADLNFRNSGAPVDTTFYQVAVNFILDYLVTGYPAVTNQYDTTADIGAGGGATTHCLGDSDTKFYVLRIGTIFQFDFATAGDVSTLSYSSKSLAIFSSIARDFRFSSDGTKLYVSNYQRIYQYTLSTAWDISTGSLDTFLNVETYNSNAFDVECFCITPDGETLYLIGDDRGVYEVSLTGGDIDTATGLTKILTLPLYWVTSGSDFRSPDFSPDGHKFYVHFLSNKTSYQYEVPVAHDLSTAFLSSRSLYHTTGELGYPLRIGKDGDRFYTTLAESSAIIICDSDDITSYNLPYEILSTNVDTSEITEQIGVYYRNETPLSTVLDDIASCIFCSFTVSALGTFFLGRPANVSGSLDDATTIHDINFGDFYGRNYKEHCIHKETIPKTNKTTVYYDQNFTVQNESELAASVTEDNKAYYSTPHQTTSISASIDAEDIVAKTFRAGSSLILSYLANLRSTKRYIFEWNTSLKWASLLSDFGLCSVIRVNGDIHHPMLSDQDKVMVTRRKANWSKEKQILEVFK